MAAFPWAALRERASSALALQALSALPVPVGTCLLTGLWCVGGHRSFSHSPPLLPTFVSLDPECG